ncbi:hypothetical protein PCANC_00288 [Puccinia coronata f. sp. avenae]|uniref:DASH complex subunit SPC19 n=1 Tax=Puccinia coronata f. sp. avenae TaxID=200324 RepID=A0A2N5W907_9BASI|nr:hypothetical protein PCANC_00288 [Puccinia coronata f. sp. avenae]
MSTTTHQALVFPDIISSLRKSGRSLEKCNSNLSLCNQTLDLHTREVPRINHALKNSQFFEVVSVSEIRAAQYQLTSELEPQIKQLVKQTENGLVKLQKREQMLRTNVCVCVCISKRKNLLYKEEILDELVEEEEDEDEGIDSKMESITTQKLKEQEHLLQQLRSKKNSLMKELDRLDQQLSKKY